MKGMNKLFRLREVIGKILASRHPWAMHGEGNANCRCPSGEGMMSDVVAPRL